MFTTLGVMVYAARPWGDNYAYQSLSGYLVLLLFMGWALAPYAALMVSNAWLGGSRPGGRLVFVAVLLTTGLGLWVIADAVFLHPDAQGALVFVVLPLYQWLIVGLVLVLGFWMGRKR